MDPHSPDFAMRHAGYEKCATVDVLEQTNGPNIYVTIWDTRNVLKKYGGCRSVCPRMQQPYLMIIPFVAE